MAALMLSCQSRPSAELQANRFQPQPNQDGFSLLWEAHERRCQKKVEGNTSRFFACQSFEWQTSLYNTSTAPRPARVHLRIDCPGGDAPELYLGAAAHPPDIVASPKVVRLAAAWKEIQVKLSASDALLEFEVPPRQKASLLAYLPASDATHHLPPSCTIRYKIELTPI